MDTTRSLRILSKLSLWITVGLAAFAVVLLAYKPSSDFSLLYTWFFMPQFLVLAASVLSHSSISLTCGALWGCMAVLGTLLGCVLASPDPEPMAWMGYLFSSPGAFLGATAARLYEVWHPRRGTVSFLGGFFGVCIGIAACLGILFWLTR